MSVSGVDIFQSGSGTWNFNSLHPTLRIISLIVRLGDGGSIGGTGEPGNGGAGGNSATKSFSNPLSSYSYVVGAINGGASSAAGFSTSAGYDTLYAGSAGGASSGKNGGNGGNGGGDNTVSFGGSGGSGGSKNSDGNPGSQSSTGGGGGGGGGDGKNGTAGGNGAAGCVAFYWTGVGTTYLNGGNINGGNYANT